VRTKSGQLAAVCGGVVVAALCAGCRDPLAAFQERPGDLAQRLPAERLRSMQPLAIELFKRPGEATGADAAPAAPGDPAAVAAAVKQRQESAPTVEWSLADVRAAAVANNLDLKVSLVDPAIADQALAIERAKFDAVFTPKARYRNDDPATLNTTASGMSQTVDASAGVSVPLRTGGRANVDLVGSYNQTNNPFVTSSQAYGLGMDASISLPLLRGAGRDVNAASIKIAGYEADIAAAGTRLSVINVLAAAERAYWRLVAARQELGVRQKQFELAQAQVEKATRRVNAGDLAKIELTRAQSGAALDLEAIITAETNVLITQRELKHLVNAAKPGESGGMSGPDPVLDSTMVVPTTPPEAAPYDLPAEKLITLAESGRMELLQTELQVLADALNIDLASDRTKFGLDADASYSFNGLGTGADAAFTSLTGRKFQSWTVGLTGNMPIGNRAAEADLRRAVLVRLQRLGSLDARKQTIRQEVLDAVDRVGSAWQRIMASQQSSILAGRTLDAETRQFDAGMRTSTDVLDAAARLADAQSSEVRALADYRIALVDLAVATGTVLGESGVVWESAPAPPLSGDVLGGMRPAKW
jgi:outer membrane protein